MAKKKNTRLRAGIIGCGMIGSQMDEKSFSRSFPKTHAGMYESLPFFELAALCESQPLRLKAAQKFWRVPFSSTSIEEFLKQPLDVVSLCTPPEGREKLIEKILASGVKVILCEKPVAIDLAKMKAIAQRVEKSSARMPINYIRRYDENLWALAENLKKQKWGPVQKVVCHYGKGFKNNGSHMLDLLEMFFGSPRSARVLDGIADDRLGSNDPTLSVQLFYERPSRFSVYLTAQNHLNYTSFEVDIFLNQARIVIRDAGREIEFYKVTKDPDFTGYLILKKDSAQKKGLRKTFLNAGEELYELCNNPRKSPRSSVQNSIQIYKTLDAIQKSWSKKGRKVLISK